MIHLRRHARDVIYYSVYSYLLFFSHVCFIYRIYLRVLLLFVKTRVIYICFVVIREAFWEFFSGRYMYFLSKYLKVCVLYFIILCYIKNKYGIFFFFMEQFFINLIAFIFQTFELQNLKGMIISKTH